MTITANYSPIANTNAMTFAIYRKPAHKINSSMAAVMLMSKKIHDWLGSDTVEIFRKGRQIFVVGCSESNHPGISDRLNTVSSTNNPDFESSITKACRKIEISSIGPISQQYVEPTLTNFNGFNAVTFELPQAVRIIRTETSGAENVAKPTLRVVTTENNKNDMTVLAKELLNGKDARSTVELIRSLIAESKNNGIQGYRFDENGILRASIISSI